MSALDAARVRRWTVAFVSAFEASRAELDDLDRQTGDGDFGSNLAPALERTAAALESAGESDPRACFAALSAACMEVGGTSGPLFGVWFRELARASAGHDQVSAEMLAAGATKGLAAVAALGGAAVGDKTMIDAMAPAAEALERASAGDATTAVAAAAAAAREGALATAALTARRGRASYVGEAARGVRDPGAVAVALFFEALAET